MTTLMQRLLHVSTPASEYSKVRICSTLNAVITGLPPRIRYAGNYHPEKDAGAEQ